MTDEQNQSSDSSTSLTLLARLRNDEQDAWQAVDSLYSPLVFHWLKRFDIVGADADDVRQEVFRLIAAKLPRFRKERESDTFRGWMRAVTRNAALMHFRKNNRQPIGTGGTEALAGLNEHPDSLQLTEAEDQQEFDTLQQRALDLVRAEFADRTWTMFWAAVVEDRSPDSIGQEMGVSAAAVRKAKSRVLQKLRSEFAELIE